MADVEPAEPDPKCAKFFLIPQRYLTGIMLSLGLVCSYTMRISLSMAITEMVPYRNTTSFNQTGGCPEPDEESIQTVKDRTVLYIWTEEQQGLILSSFYWGYIFSHFPGGYISEFYGGKHVLGLGVLLNVVLNLLTPSVITWSNGSWQLLICLRFMQGIGQGPLFPSMNSILGQWIPITERAFISNIAFSGAHVGTILGNFVSGVLIIATKSWKSVFYFFGGMGLLWCCLWQLLCYSRPTSHPCIKVKERNFVRKETERDVTLGKKTMPWKGMFTSVPLWALVVGQFGHDWGWFTLITDLPKYMKSVLKFNVKENAVWSSLPYVILFVVNIAMGYVADWIIKHKYMHITNQRKLFTTIGAMGPAVFLVLAAYVGCNQVAAVSMFTIALTLMFGFYSGTKVNAMDLAPNFAGTAMAVVNGLGTFAGMVAPYMVGVLAPNQTLDEWKIVFWVCFGVFGITNLAFLIWASGEVQPWNSSGTEREN